MLALPAPEMALQFRLDEIAAQEQKWMDEGYCVGVLVKEIGFWAERGIYTASDFDAMQEREAQRDYRKMQMAQWDDEYDRWCAERENDPEYIAEMERESSRCGGSA